MKEPPNQMDYPLYSIIGSGGSLKKTSWLWLKALKKVLLILKG
jgi:hypothetical protein